MCFNKGLCAGLTDKTNIIDPIAFFRSLNIQEYILFNFIHIFIFFVIDIPTVTYLQKTRISITIS